MKLLSFSAAIFVLAGLNASAQSVPSPGAAWALGQSDAKVLVGLDLKGLRESPTGKMLFSQLGSLSPQQAGPAGMFLPIVIQALNDVDSISISSSGQTPLAKPGSSGTNPPFLVVVQGRMASSPLNFFKSGVPQEYKGAQIYQAPAGSSKSQDTGLAMLNESTMLLGDGKSLRAAIDHQTQPNGGLPQGLRARAADLQKDHDFWIVLQESLAKLQPGNAQLAGPAADIDGMEMGIGLHDGLLLDVNVTAKSEGTVRMMAQMISMQLESAIESQKRQGLPGAEFADRLKVSTEGKTLRVHMKLTQEELEQQMQSMQTARSLAQNMDPAREKIFQVKQPKVAQSTKIKILGLDDGPREIELK